MATKVLSDPKVFKILAQADRPLTVQELADETHADPALISRLLKHCATELHVQESGQDTYNANDVTKCIASPGAQGAIDDTYQVIRIAGIMPDFLKQCNYANPVDKRQTAWNVAFQTDQHFFEYVNSPGNERQLEALRNHMQFKTVGLRWYEVPKLMETVLGHVEAGYGAVTLVDVGGNSGQDLLDFRSAHPSMSGRFILQDLPSTIEALDTTSLVQGGIEFMGHDFFTPQPVHSAKVYYLKMCLHDWPNEQCHEILSQIKPALVPGHSRILLDEIVVPNEKAGWFETSLDVIMMQVNSAQERREREWITLVNGVGDLKVKQI